MRRWILPLALVVLAVGAVAWLQHLQSRSRSGYPAPDFTLPDLNGTQYRLSDLRGKVIFLNLWATWCLPCRTEMPAMEDLYRRLKHRDFVMLAVSEDVEGANVVAPFVTELGLTFPVLLDPDARLSPRYGVTGYPETFLIDREGRVVHHTVGPAHWNSEELFQYINVLIDGAPVSQ